MTPDLLELLSVDSMAPRETVVLGVLGEADPDALTLADIADAAGSHIAGYGSAIAALHARRFIARDPGRPGDRAPLYRLLPRGQAAYQQLERIRGRRARSRRLAEQALPVGRAA